MSLFSFWSFKDKAPTFIIPVYCGSDSLKEYPDTIKRIEFNYEPQPLPNGVNVPILDYITKNKSAFINNLLVDISNKDTTIIKDITLQASDSSKAAVFEVYGKNFSRYITSNNGKILALEDSYCVFSDMQDNNLWKIIKK